MYEDSQNEITRLVVRCAQLLLAYGAESDLVEEISQRLGKALGLASIEISISSNALVLTSLVHGRCVTTTRRIRAHGINMTVICELQRICILAEKGIYGANEVRRRLAHITPKTYPAIAVVPMIGLSCASFHFLSFIRCRHDGMFNHIFCLVYWHDGAAFSSIAPFQFIG